MSELRPRLRRFLELFVLSLAGSVPVAGFFITGIFPNYSSLFISEQGTVMMLTPLVIGMLFGFLLTEHDIRSVAAGTLVITIFSSIFVVIFIYSPILAGVASAAPATAPADVLEIFVAQRVLLLVIITFPILLMGAVVGRSISERVVPSEELRRELEQLKKETREWHELLKRRGEARDYMQERAATPEVKSEKDSERPR